MQKRFKKKKENLEGSPGSIDLLLKLRGDIEDVCESRK